MGLWVGIGTFVAAYAVIRLLHRTLRRWRLNGRERSPAVVVGEINQLRSEMEVIAREYVEALRDSARAAYAAALERAIDKAGDRLSEERADGLRVLAETVDLTAFEKSVSDFAKWPHRARPLPLSATEVPSDLTTVRKQAGSAVSGRLSTPIPSPSREEEGFLRRIASKGAATVSEATFKESIKGAATSAPPERAVAVESALDRYVAQHVALRELHIELQRMGLPDTERARLLDYPTGATAL